MRRNNNRLAAAVAVAALAGGGAGATAVTLTHGSSHDAEQAAVATPSVSNVASSALSVGQIAKADTPSVVEIDATEAAPDSPFPGGSQRASALGTGFIYDTKGNIVTNEHVVSGSTSVSVLSRLVTAFAHSRPVTASSIPRLQPRFVFPVSFAAPRMVVEVGCSTKSPSALPCGARPIRRE